MEPTNNSQNNQDYEAADANIELSKHIRLSRLTANSDLLKTERENKPLTTLEALTRLDYDINQEIEQMKNEYAKRGLVSWICESISFKSELSKMRWPSVIFMSAQAIAHFIVAFILNVDNLATKWVGFQGFILFSLLVFNLAANFWDTQLRFKELLMKAEQIRDLVRRCSQDKHLLSRWKKFSWKSASPRKLFVPKSPCVHRTLTYRDESCLNLPDYLIVQGDIIHLYPGEKAPSDCLSLNTVQSQPFSHGGQVERIQLNDGEVFHSLRVYNKLARSSKDTSRKLDFNNDDMMAHAKLKKANKGSDFLVLTTPYIKSLRISLQRSYKRPVNSIEKECFIVSRKYFETYVIPLVFILSTIVTAIHYAYLDLTDNDQQIKPISIVYLLLRPSLTIMPFLPWMFPCFWTAVNAYGSARLLCCAEAQRKKSLGRSNDIDQSPDWNKPPPGIPGDISKFDNLLATPTANCSSDQNKHDDDNLHELRNDVGLMSIFRLFIELICGKGGHVWRSSSLLQVLGCLTSLCCIDKVGILSWPNPAPEKVFVLTQSKEGNSSHLVAAADQTTDETSSQGQTVGGAGENHQTLIALEGEDLSNMLGGHFQADDHLSSNNDHPSVMKHNSNISSSGKPEVFDISQSFNSYRGCNDPLSAQNMTRLQFDDLAWRKYIDNLKPLGLAILMNNCCENSFGDYFRFYKHISYESVLRCNLTPVVKRRCICALSDLIGFSQNALKNYEFVNQIGMYKLIDPRNIDKGKLVSSLENTTRLKLPFPNMTCNIHRDTLSGSYQVFSQGTADVVLDACVEYWDGTQLVALDDIVRKRIKDFYHRTSLTSYCSAFSYTPLLKAHNLADHYVELPSESSKLSSRIKKLANELDEEFLQKQVINLQSNAPTRKTNQICDQSNLSGKDNMQNDISRCSTPQSSYFHTNNVNSVASPSTIVRILRRHLSLEDIQTNGHEDKSLIRCPMSEGKSRKLDAVLDELTDQVFVGMVANQYQACPDFVSLVEQLEHACIRFVHFSKENELRSRVFSEKMGLESGWNCHISLQSDQDLDKADHCHANLFKTSHEMQPDDKKIFKPPTRISNILIGNQNRNLARKTPESIYTNDEISSRRDSISSDERTLYSWRSLPSLVSRIISRVSSKNRSKQVCIGGSKRSSIHDQINSSDEDSYHNGEGAESEEKAENLPSVDGNSIKDEGFESLAFDMSNRAKLPKGIENIRPHLETVDNIPLQVSLFTDCTPALTKEMIEIMQDYGEIVCVIGSSSSRLNTAIFLQANASIAIEPLMPQTCTKNVACKRSSRSIKRVRKSRSKSIKSRGPEHGASNDNNTSGGQIEDESKLGFTVIHMNQAQRPSNPRDRLGIGPITVTETNLNGRKVGGNKRRRKISTSSESSPSESDEDLHSSNNDHDFSPSSSPSQTLTSTRSWHSKSSCSSAPDSDLSSDDSCENDSVIRETSSKRRQSKVSSQEHLSGSTGDVSDLLNELPDPSSLASKMASLPCSYSYSRTNQVNLYSLILEARHFTFKMKNTFVCMICFALSISSAQFLASILFLPPMLSSGLTIWLTVVVVPLMSFSLMSTTMDSQVMKIAVGKNLQLKPENITFFVICYLIKFIPSVVVVVLNFGLIIAHSCKLTGFGSSSLGPCWMFTYVQHGNTTSAEEADEDLLWSSHLLTAQVSAAFLIVLYFVVISSGFVHRSHLMWERSPTRNHLWVVISVLLIVGQFSYNQLVLEVNLNSSKIPYEFLASLPLHIWLVSFIWPILVVGINLLVKRAEIKATIRQQRRARFDFNTKLGMNSPF